MAPTTQLERDGFVRLQTLAASSGVDVGTLLRRSVVAGVDVSIYLGERTVQFLDGTALVPTTSEDFSETYFQALGEPPWEPKAAKEHDELIRLYEAGLAEPLVEEERVGEATRHLIVIEDDVFSLITQREVEVTEIGVDGRPAAVRLCHSLTVNAKDLVVEVSDANTLLDHSWVVTAEGNDDVSRTTTGPARKGRRFEKNCFGLVGALAMLAADSSNVSDAFASLLAEGEKQSLVIEEDVCRRILKNADAALVGDWEPDPTVSPEQTDALLALSVTVIGDRWPAKYKRAQRLNIKAIAEAAERRAASLAPEGHTVEGLSRSSVGEYVKRALNGGLRNVGKV